MRSITVPAPMTVYPSPSRAVSFGLAGEYEVEDDVAVAAIAKGATDGAASQPAKAKRASKRKAARKSTTPAPEPIDAIVEPVTDPDPEPTE